MRTMDEGMYFGFGSENTSKITIDRRNTDKPNGFVFCQPGKGYGIHADAQPSGIASTGKARNGKRIAFRIGTSSYR